MNPTKTRLTMLLAVLGGTLPVAAQTAPTQSAEPDDKILKLDEFVVTSAATSGYRATNSITATGVGTQIGDTPSTISVVTKDLLADTRTDLINDALRFVPGVVTSPTNESQPFVRGFQGTYTLRNGVFRRQNLTTWNVDRVEVIQGPSSIFYSNIRPGGVINYVTTKPVFAQNFIDLNLSGGSYDYRRAEAAFNGAIGKNLAFRVDVGSLDTNSFREQFHEKQTFISLSALWNITPNQVVSFEIADEETDRRNAWSSYWTPLTNSRYWNNPAAIASGQNVTTWMAANYPGLPAYDEFAPFAPSPNDPYGRVTPVLSKSYARNSDKPIDLTYHAKLTDQLAFSLVLNYAWENAEGTNPVLSDPLANDTVPNAAVEFFKNARDSYNVNSRLTYRFKFAGINNTAMLGNDNQWVTLRNPVVNGSSNQRGPTYFYDPKTTPPPNADVSYQLSTAPLNSLRDTLQYFRGTYIVDQASMLNDTLFLTAGVRYTDFKQHISYPGHPEITAQPDALAKRWTPQLGALYKVVKGIGVFGTYSESVIPQTQIDASGKSVEPILAKGYDIGIKTDLLDGRLTSTIDYYQINETNVAVVDPVANVAHGLPAGQTVFAYYTYGNAQRVRGAQVDLNFNISDDYQLILGMNHFFEADFVAPQSNPLNVGVPLPYQPENTFTVWNRYHVSSGSLAGFFVGGGFHYNSRAALGGSFNNSQVFVPSFMVWDGLVGYQTKLLGHKVEFRVNVKNLFDKEYRDAFGVFNSPRTIIGTVSTRF
ncbi:MAG TPA: TonB-dependent receptor [Opitutaceae bacterium]|nr:TonB-dependent receptor [Opitutaceae bacterium]